MVVKERTDLTFGQPFPSRDEGLADAPGSRIYGSDVEKEVCAGLTVVPYGQGGVEMTGFDEGAAIEGGVDGAEAQDLGFGAAGGGAVYVWRSGLGITADGALVYVGGPSLNIADLANLLVRAGAVRAIELDINTDWVNYSTYQPPTPTGLASGLNGTELLSNMTGTPNRYFESWWARDFITMSSVSGG